MLPKRNIFGILVLVFSFYPLDMLGVGGGCRTS
jgi:hypothetical protein